METPRPVDLRTIGRFLIGRRDSIESVAADPRSIWIGLALVFAASLGREYDAEYLVAEPWHLLFGPVASVAAATILFVVLAIVLALRWADRRALLTTYRRFLGLFWMTAPLAFIYALPVERFLDEPGAMRANLAMLGVVAAWRVVLIIRVASVFFQVPVLRAVWPVMMMSAGLALAAINSLDIQSIVVMGGIHSTPAEEVLRGVAMIVGTLSFLSLPVWTIASLVVWSGARRDRPAPFECVTSAAADRRAWSAYVPALALSAALLPALPSTQSEQALRHQFEQLVEAGDDRNAMDFMLRHRPWEFPPGYQPRQRANEELRERYDDETQSQRSSEDY